MKIKIISILVCMLSLFTIFSVATAQKMTKEYEKDKNHSIVFLDNNPPTDPVITCPNTVKKNRIFLVRAVSVDPEGDDIYYRLKVGESGKPSQWIGPRESGVKYATGMGIFNYLGEIKIGFQAKDVYDAESDWSYHTINFINSKSKSVISPLKNIIQNHPLMFPLLQKILLLQR